MIHTILPERCLLPNDGPNTYDMPRVIVDSDDDDVVSEVGGEDPIADHDGIFEYAEQEKANDVCADQHSVIHDTSASPERSGTRNDSCAGERKGNDRTQSTGSTGMV